MGLDLADEIADAQAEVNDAGHDIFTDLCSIIVSTSVPDGFGGTTETFTTLASDIPCKYETGSPMQVQIGGGQITTLTHRITMGATAITKAIKSHHQIVIEAHHDTPELTFENPVVLSGSLSVRVKVAAAVAQ